VEGRDAQGRREGAMSLWVFVLSGAPRDRSTLEIAASSGQMQKEAVMAQPNDVSGNSDAVNNNRQSPAAKRGTPQDYTKFTKDSVKTNVNEKFDDNASAWELFGHEPDGFSAP
jgi:hypothetical protein